MNSKLSENKILELVDDQELYSVTGGLLVLAGSYFSSLLAYYLSRKEKNLLIRFLKAAGIMTVGTAVTSCLYNMFVEKIVNVEKKKK